MPDCQCDKLDRMFDATLAERDLRDYLRSGPDGSTQKLIDALRSMGVGGRTLLDVGGGIGAIQLELLHDGLAAATDVDASAAYVEVARREATARGYADRLRYHVGDFVALAPGIEMADLVTLDRVICCYRDLDSLVALSAARARLRLGVVHPIDRRWARWGAAILNAIGGRFGRPAFFVHPTASLEAILGRAGLEREWAAQTLFWRIAIYRRTSG